jgi:hypothetical protein
MPDADATGCAQSPRGTRFARCPGLIDTPACSENTVGLRTRSSELGPLALDQLIQPFVFRAMARIAG